MHIISQDVNNDWERIALAPSEACKAVSEDSLPAEPTTGREDG